MAAIAGVVTLQPDASASALLSRLLHRMRHRAPDGVAAAGDAGWAIGHGALRVGAPHEATPQPVVAAQHVLVMDGRVDDRGGLIAALGLSGSPPMSDAELVSHAWARWGEDMVERLVGDFAVAVWDTRERVLWLLRDRVGVRPLYWVRTPALVAFASEPEALLGLPGVSHEPSEARVLYALHTPLGDGDPRGTWYRDVCKVLPGERLRVASGLDVQHRRWWQAAPLEPLRLRDRGEYLEALQQVFGEAVRCRAMSTPRPYLMLSGGIDSAAILAMLRRDGGGMQAQAIAVSALADAPEHCAESSNILRMLATERESLRLPVPSFSGEVSLADFARLPWSPAHPVDNSLLLPMLVYQAVCARGGRVVLDGIDGDLVMSTRDDYPVRFALQGQWRAALHEARMAARYHTYLKGHAPMGMLAKGMLSRMEPLAASRLRYAWAAARMRRDGAGPWIPPEVVKRHGLDQRWADQAVRRREALVGASHAAQLAYVWEHAGMNRGMEGYDHLAARFGLEPRHPWADQRVLDFFLRLPLEQGVRNGWTKSLAREASAPWLGAEVVWHSGKAHLGSDVLTSMMRHRLPELRTAVLAARGPLSPWVPVERLERLAGRLAPDAAIADGWEAFNLATLGAWLGNLS